MAKTVVTVTSMLFALQAFTWMIMSLLAILCNFEIIEISIPDNIEDVTQGFVLNYIMYLVFFVDLSPLEADTDFLIAGRQSLWIFGLLYIIVGIGWLGSSLQIFFASKNNRWTENKPLIYVWLGSSALVWFIDFILVVLLGADLATLQDRATGILALENTAVATGVVMTVAARGYVLWILNLVLVVVVYRKYKSSAGLGEGGYGAGSPYGGAPGSPYGGATTGSPYSVGAPYSGTPAAAPQKKSMFGGFGKALNVGKNLAGPLAQQGLDNANFDGAEMLSNSIDVAGQINDMRQSNRQYQQPQQQPRAAPMNPYQQPYQQQQQQPSSSHYQSPYQQQQQQPGPSSSRYDNYSDVTDRYEQVESSGPSYKAPVATPTRLANVNRNNSNYMPRMHAVQPPQIPEPDYQSGPKTALKNRSQYQY